MYRTLGEKNLVVDRMAVVGRMYVHLEVNMPGWGSNAQTSARRL